MTQERFPRQTENERAGGQHGTRNIQSEEGERQLKDDHKGDSPKRKRAPRDDSSSEQKG